MDPMGMSIPTSFFEPTLPETNISHLKMDGWKSIVSFWDGLFSGAMLVLGSVTPTNHN